MSAGSAHTPGKECAWPARCGQRMWQLSVAASRAARAAPTCRTAPSACCPPPPAPAGAGRLRRPRRPRTAVIVGGARPPGPAPAGTAGRSRRAVRDRRPKNTSVAPVISSNPASSAASSRPPPAAAPAPSTGGAPGGGRRRRLDHHPPRCRLRPGRDRRLDRDHPGAQAPPCPPGARPADDRGAGDQGAAQHRAVPWPALLGGPPRWLVNVRSTAIGPQLPGLAVALPVEPDGQRGARLQAVAVAVHEHTVHQHTVRRHTVAGQRPLLALGAAAVLQRDR